MMIVIFFVIAAVNAINFQSVLESIDAECPKQCPECEWATLLLDGMHKLHATIDKVSIFCFITIILFIHVLILFSLLFSLLDHFFF